MAELIVKEIVNPFRKEEKISNIELDLYSKLINKKKIVNDNSDIVKDFFGQLMDKKDINKNLNN